jgi:hypothetical protein
MIFFPSWILLSLSAMLSKRFLSVILSTSFLSFSISYYLNYSKRYNCFSSRIFLYLSFSFLTIYRAKALKWESYTPIFFKSYSRPWAYFLSFYKNVLFEKVLLSESNISYLFCLRFLLLRFLSRILPILRSSISLAASWLRPFMNRTVLINCLCSLNFFTL